MGDTRLDSLSPLLAEYLNRSPLEEQRRLALLAIELACHTTGLQKIESIRKAVELIEIGKTPAADLKSHVAVYATQLDDQYLSATSDEERMLLFNRARAASAVVFANNGEEEWHETIYEAAMAYLDPLVLKLAPGSASSSPEAAE